MSIEERIKPEPGGRPGYLRIDTVHQGDQDPLNAVYHINAVDEVTQWEIVGSVEQITEGFVIPMLEGMLAQFPFQILGFHSDHGSEYINHLVAELLRKLLIEQTKSRPRHSNDNGLADSKNGAVVRKHIGHTHIATAHAQAIASISGFQCCISGAFQPLMPWPPPSIGISSQLAPTFFIASHMAGDWSYVT